MSLFTPHRKLTVGHIYETQDGELIRLIRGGGGGYFSGRGCTRKSATPYNHYRAQDLIPATFSQVNKFLASEMEQGMALKTNPF
jgi:hypothetical protein